MRQLFGFATLALVGCTESNPLVGDDIGVIGVSDDFTLAPAEAPVDGEDNTDDPNIRDTGTTAFAEGDGIPDGYQGLYGASCMAAGALPTDPPMTATTSPGAIHITHEGILTSIEPGWVIHGTVDSEGSIQMYYEETNTDATMESCVWRLVYSIEGVPAGDWTVHAREDQVSVTVPE